MFSVGVFRASGHASVHASGRALLIASKNGALSFLAMFILFLAGAFQVVDAQGQEAPVEVFATMTKAETLIKKYYPKATVERKNGVFTAKFDTRQFMIHHALKTGEWQEARAQEGPNMGGIMCTIDSSPGHWIGAAMVPQTFNERYFESTLMAPYSKSLDRHLVVHLNYPSGTAPDFLRSFQLLIQEFAAK